MTLPVGTRVSSDRDGARSGRKIREVLPRSATSQAKMYRHCQFGNSPEVRKDIGVILKLEAM